MFGSESLRCERFRGRGRTRESRSGDSLWYATIFGNHSPVCTILYEIFAIMPTLYYILKPAVDRPDTGPVFPQVQKMSPGYDYKSPNSVHALSRADGFPDFEPALDYFIVHSRARLSDLLSVSVIHGGFLISKKFKEVVTAFNLVSHKFYPAKVSHKKQLHEYYWMHVISDFTDIVDYRRSSFFIYSNYAHNLGQIDITSKEELIQKRKEVKAANPGKTVTIWADRIILTNSFDRSLDLFEIGMFNSDTYISPELKDAIVSNNISGCDISEASNLIV